MDQHRSREKTYAAFVANIKSELGLAKCLVMIANIIANPHNPAIRTHVEGMAYSANIGATIMVGTTITTSLENQLDMSSVDKV